MAENKQRKYILTDNPSTPIPAGLLSNLPEGIFELGPGDQLPKELKYLKQEEVVVIKGCGINLGKVTIDGLKQLRRYWPKKDYRLLKNRRSARNQRILRKAELNDFEVRKRHQQAIY